MFMPKSTEVDPETGSHYLIENGQAVIDVTRAAAAQQLLAGEIEDPASLGLSPEQTAELANDLQSWRNEYARVGEFQPGEMPEPQFDKYITSEEQYNALTAADLQRFYAYETLLKYRGLYKKSENPIAAQAYWEKWFREHPGKKPNRIVYYDGDPNQAVVNFMADNSIVSDHDLQLDPYNTDNKLLRLQDSKLKLPESTTIDVGVFRAHEHGNWMYRVAKNAP
jgi:hypothetical protein